MQFLWNDYEFTVVQLGRGQVWQNLPRHQHSINSYEMHFVTKGSGSVIINDSEFQLKKGDFYMTGPLVYHEQITNPEDNTEELFLYLQASGKDTNNLIVQTFLQEPFYFEENSKLGYFFEKFDLENYQKKIGWESNVAAYIQLLLTALVRTYAPDLKNNEESEQLLYEKRFLLIDNAFIHHAPSITLPELAERIGLSERQTQRLIEKYYHKSFKEKKEEDTKAFRKYKPKKN
ncbi:MAG: AraC family ligand binding domain-containing protein [Treponema sp.]|nr:AraC family ligand binding domain-containing protein [Treponema sp.]